MYGKKSPEERARLLQAMEILVARVGEQVSGAIPQVRNCLSHTEQLVYELTT